MSWYSLTGWGCAGSACGGWGRAGASGSCSRLPAWSVYYSTCSVVQVADLSLRSTADCRDRLQVREEGLTLLTLCGDLEGRATVISTNNQVSHLES